MVMWEESQDLCLVCMVPPSDQYIYRTPIPKHMLKYTKVKVPHTQDKHS